MQFIAVKINTRVHNEYYGMIPTLTYLSVDIEFPQRNFNVKLFYVSS